MRCLTIASLKGGVGKTTLLLFALAVGSAPANERRPTYSRSTVTPSRMPA